MAQQKSIINEHRSLEPDVKNLVLRFSISLQIACQLSAKNFVLP